MNTKFVYSAPTKIYFGEDQLDNLADELKQFGTRVLLTYGGGSIKKNGLYDNIMGVLKNAGLDIFELGGIEPNPRHTTVNKGADICKKENIDVLLAVGGGSTIDATKAIGAATFYDGDCWDLVTQKAQVTNCLPIITILTLSATGSEMNTGAVISNMETNQKYGMGHATMLPKVSFLDPTTTYTVNAYQTACGSVDILSHIFDVGYFTNDEGLYMVDLFIESLIKTVVKYAPIALNKPDNYGTRANLMWASSWALNGFIAAGKSLFPILHIMEHELSAYYDITHGHGLAILTPRWMEYILDEHTAPKIHHLGVVAFGIDENMPAMDGSKKAIEKVSDFYFNTLGLQSKLSDLGIDNSKLAEMAKNICRNGDLSGYKPLTQQDVENIFKMCL
ncbi:MAG: iron-containing alcohol dehydrogenase [Anaerolineaceae bacterium]|nr:iron-containing alcohol dehydrogenase [Anaerolineaceae bacterium]